MKNSFFETIKINKKHIFHLQHHQKRYENVLSFFGKSNFENLQNFIAPPDDSLYRCKLIYDHDAIKSVEYYPYQKREVKSLKIIHDDTIEYQMKFLNRDNIDALFSKKDDCDDVLIVKNNLVADTSIANVAFYDGKKWLTPAQPLLQGTTRQRFLDANELHLADIRVEDLKSFEKVALLNAMIDFDIIHNMRFA